MLQDSQVSDEVLASALARHYSPALLQLAGQMLPTTSPVAAVRQVLEQAVAARHRYTGEQRLRVWLYRLMYQLSTSRLPLRPLTGRAQMVIPKPAVESQPTPASPAEDASPAPSQVEDPFWQSAERLASSQRLLLLLRYGHELTLPEIAYVQSSREHGLHTRFNVLRKTLAVEGSRLHNREDSARVNEDGSYLHTRSRELALLQQDGLLEGEVHAADRQLLKDHLFECLECAAQVQNEQLLEQRLRQAFQQHAAPVSLADAELAELEQGLASVAREKRTRSGIRRSLKELSFSLMLAALVGLAIWYGALDTPAEANAPPDTGQNQGLIETLIPTVEAELRETMTAEDAGQIGPPSSRRFAPFKDIPAIPEITESAPAKVPAGQRRYDQELDGWYLLKKEWIRNHGTQSAASDAGASQRDLAAIQIDAGASHKDSVASRTSSSTTCGKSSSSVVFEMDNGTPRILSEQSFLYSSGLQAMHQAVE